jgi:hypothetical protein
VRPYKGIPGGLISEDTHRPADADFAGGYLLQSIGVMPLTYAGEVARGRGLWGDELRNHMRGYNHTAGINILGDCLPHDGNEMVLSDELDGRGLPKPLIRFTAGDNERRMTTHAEKIMRRIWDAAGATDVWAFDRYAHTIGTCRMGASGQDAVVDADCRAFDLPNLSICDNSVFPSALAANPALTSMAAARAMTGAAPPPASPAISCSRPASNVPIRPSTTVASAATCSPNAAITSAGAKIWR